MKPEPITFPPRYPRGVVLQFPAQRPMFQGLPQAPRSWLQPWLAGVVGVCLIVLPWVVMGAIAAWIWKAVRP